MLRVLLYPLYLLAPYLLVYESIFHGGFDWKRFVYFTMILVAARSMAADVKDAYGADKIRTDMEKLHVEFFRILLSSSTPKKASWNEIAKIRQQAPGDFTSRLKTASFAPLWPLLVKAEKNTVVLGVYAILGTYFTSYVCVANRWLSVILVPDDIGVVAKDPNRKFAMLHELGHCHPRNIAIFERQTSEGQVFGFILFIVMLAHISDPLWKFFGLLLPLFFLMMPMVSSFARIGRLEAEIHADNTATRLAYLLDRALFDKLETIQLPNDRELNVRHNRIRHERFLRTIETYKLTGFVDNLIDHTYPTLGFYISYATFVYLLCSTVVWGRGIENQSFEPWWIFVIGALLTKGGVYLVTKNVKRVVLAKVTGGEVKFPFGSDAVDQNSGTTDGVS